MALHGLVNSHRRKEYRLRLGAGRAGFRSNDRGSMLSQSSGIRRISDSLQFAGRDLYVYVLRFLKVDGRERSRADGRLSPDPMPGGSSTATDEIELYCRFLLFKCFIFTWFHSTGLCIFNLTRNVSLTIVERSSST